MLRLKTLGGLSIHSDAGPPSGAATQRRRLALLALLARAGERGLTRDKLLGYLWPDSDPEKGRNVLAQALYMLRRDLGAEDVFLGTIDLRLNPDLISNDAAEFSTEFAAGRLEQAAALYEGPFLDGFYVSEAPEFERWMEVERTNLAHDYSAALERLAAAATTRGDHRAAVTWWRKLAALDPLNSRVAVGLMQALANTGDRAGAIQHARIYETLLRQEVDAKPDQQVLALAEQLKQDTGQPAPKPPAARPAVEQPAAAAAAVTPPAITGASPPRSTPGTATATPRRRNVWRAAAVLGAILLGAVALMGRGRWWGGAHTARRMVAVLPFENLGAPQDEYFADGLTEEVTARLAGLHGLGVISRTSSMQYKHTPKSLKQIGQELGVSYVLEGSVRWTKSPDGTSRVRVTPQLIQVSDDSHLWANLYDADLADIFQVQGHIAEQVASALDVTLAAPERRDLAARPTHNLQAYDAYVRANALLDQAWGNEPSLRSAVEMFEQVLKLDSTYALAWARLAKADAMMFRLGYDDSEDRLAQAKHAVEAAWRYEPDLPEGHVALGYYHYWGRRDFTQARAELLKALERRPNDADAISGLGAVERRQGQWEDAVRHLDEASELDPRASSIAWDCGLAHFFTRDYPGAEHYLDRAISLAPEWSLPYTTKARLYLSWYGDTARARRVLNDAIAKTGAAALIYGLNDVPFLLTADKDHAAELGRLTLKEFGSDSVTYYMWKARWYQQRKELGPEQAAWDSLRGRAERWDRHMMPLEQTHPSAAEQPHVALAVAYAGLGRKEEALREIERATTLLPFSRDAAWGADRGIMFAQIYLRLGDPDRAIEQLKQLLAVPSPISPLSLQVDPVWTPLRGDPRFQQLTRAP